MNRRLLRSSAALWLAIFAWLGQAWAPVAHAAEGAHRPTDALWCSPASGGLAVALAALPAELREAMQTASAGVKHADCLQACASLAGGAPVAAPIDRFALPAAEAPTTTVAALAPARLWLRQYPARGPPAPMPAPLHI